MKYYFRWVLCPFLLVLLAGACHDSETGHEISGHWVANKISIAGDTVQHNLSNSIELDLQYPEYTFTNGKVTEEGEFYVQDRFLNLQKNSDTLKGIRQIEILKFSNDSLEILLVDSVSKRQVLFIR